MFWPETPRLNINSAPFRHPLKTEVLGIGTANQHQCSIFEPAQRHRLAPKPSPRPKRQSTPPGLHLRTTGCVCLAYQVESTRSSKSVDHHNCKDSVCGFVTRDLIHSSRARELSAFRTLYAEVTMPWPEPDVNELPSICVRYSTNARFPCPRVKTRRRNCSIAHFSGSQLYLNSRT